MMVCSKHRLELLAKALMITQLDLIQFCKENSVAMFVDSQGSYVTRSSLDWISAELRPHLTISVLATIAPSERAVVDDRAQRAKEFAARLERSLAGIVDALDKGNQARARKQLFNAKEAFKKFRKYGPYKHLQSSAQESVQDRIGALQTRINKQVVKQKPNLVQPPPKRIADALTYYRKGYSIYDDQVPNGIILGGAPSLGKRSR